MLGERELIVTSHMYHILNRDTLRLTVPESISLFIRSIWQHTEAIEDFTMSVAATAHVWMRNIYQSREQYPEFIKITVMKPLTLYLRNLYRRFQPEVERMFITLPKSLQFHLRNHYQRLITNPKDEVMTIGLPNSTELWIRDLVNAYDMTHLDWDVFSIHTPNAYSLELKNVLNKYHSEGDDDFQLYVISDFIIDSTCKPAIDYPLNLQGVINEHQDRIDNIFDIDLTWVNTSLTHTAYLVYRDTVPIPRDTTMLPYATIDYYAEAFNDPSVEEDTTYYYRVMPKSIYGRWFSNQVMIMVPLSLRAPSNISGSFSSLTQPLDMYGQFVSLTKPLKTGYLFNSLTSPDAIVFDSFSSLITSRQLKAYLTTLDSPDNMSGTFDGVTKPLNLQGYYVNTSSPVSIEGAFASSTKPHNIKSLYFSVVNPFNSEGVFQSLTQTQKTQFEFTSLNNPLDLITLFNSVTQPISLEMVGYVSLNQPVDFTGNFITAEKPNNLLGSFDSLIEPTKTNWVFSSLDLPNYVSSEYKSMSIVNGSAYFVVMDVTNTIADFSSFVGVRKAESKFNSVSDPTGIGSVYDSLTSTQLVTADYASTSTPYLLTTEFDSLNQPNNNQATFLALLMPVNTVANFEGLTSPTITHTEIEVCEIKGDPYWDSVVSLMRFNGDAIDEVGNEWTGTFVESTSSGVNGSGSLDISARLYCRDSPNDAPTDWVFYTNEATVEFHIRRQSAGESGNIVSLWPSNIRFKLELDSNQTVVFTTFIGTTRTMRFPFPFIDNELEHVAIVKGSDQKIRMYRRGVDVGVSFGPFSGIMYAGTGGSVTMGGANIDELRITKGVARYTENFTPPTEPFPNASGAIECRKVTVNPFTSISNPTSLGTSFDSLNEPSKVINTYGSVGKPVLAGMDYTSTSTPATINCIYGSTESPDVIDCSFDSSNKPSDCVNQFTSLTAIMDQDFIMSPLTEPCEVTEMYKSTDKPRYLDLVGYTSLGKPVEPDPELGGVLPAEYLGSSESPQNIRLATQDEWDNPTD